MHAGIYRDGEELKRLPTSATKSPSKSIIILSLKTLRSPRRPFYWTERKGFRTVSAIFKRSEFMAISDYIVTIGLEVHCQIKTKSKMFCSCETGFGFEPNTRVCPTCLGLPGALPVLNEFAIERTLLTGLMLGCSSPEISQWDRKNYFYPDMAKNYQTSQLDLPLCLGGSAPVPLVLSE
ncbi:MAG: hypothetical protein ACLRPT_04545 [Akkermansia muciniphila]